MTGVQRQAADLLQQLKSMDFSLAKKKGMYLDIGKMEVLQMALEKQVPMRLLYEEYYEYSDGCIDWLCPRCKRFHRTEWKMPYCSNCGQAIDWRN